MRYLLRRTYTRLGTSESEDKADDNNIEDPSSNRRGMTISWPLRILLAVLGVGFLVSLGLAVARVAIQSDDPAPRHCTELAIRREWRQLNDTERASYISAVKCLQTHPSKTTSVGRRSDDFPWLHRQMARVGELWTPSLNVVIFSLN